MMGTFNTITVKIILSRNISLRNLFFAAFRNQYTRLELSATVDGINSVVVFDNIPKSTSDVISNWMSRNYTKLPFYNELVISPNKKVMTLVISGGY